MLPSPCHHSVNLNLTNWVTSNIYINWVISTYFNISLIWGWNVIVAAIIYNRYESGNYFCTQYHTGKCDQFESTNKKLWGAHTARTGDSIGEQKQRNPSSVLVFGWKWWKWLLAQLLHGLIQQQHQHRSFHCQFDHCPRPPSHGTYSFFSVHFEAIHEIVWTVSPLKGNGGGRRNSDKGMDGVVPALPPIKWFTVLGSVGFSIFYILNIKENHA